MLGDIKRTLEAKYGSVLDQWLANGQFLQADWRSGLNLLASQERLVGFIRKLVRDAVSQR